MKRALKTFVLVFFLSISSLLATSQVPNSGSLSDTSEILQPKANHYKEAMLVTAILGQYHYNKPPFNDSLSSIVFERFINTLDNSRQYFMASDLEVLEDYRFHLDDDLKNGNLGAPFAIFEVFRHRFYNRVDKIQKRLHQGKSFDFTKDEFFDVNRESVAWAASERELDEIWRKNLKSQALNLKLSGDDWDTIVQKLTKRYEQYRKAISQYNSDDVFQLFMNSFSEAYDPHTNYFSPKRAAEFRIDMSRSLEGIGAQLGVENDYIVVKDIIPGGPAFKTNSLNVDDKIVAVAQEGDSIYTDLVGWRVDDAVQLIRGPKGTVVKLKVVSAEAGIHAKPKEVVLMRDKINLEEQSAQKKVIKFDNKEKSFKFGVITIPAFYLDFEAVKNGEEEFQSTHRDVKKLLGELKEEKVDGLIVDLRFNGGGSLEEAIQLTGLFINEGPVVQIRRSDGTVEHGEDDNPEVDFDGPLVVLVNRFSASASEIFAGAIQDYKRGLIIGEQTFGKGTVQQVIGLNRFLNTDEPLGQLKLTLAKYYRVTGSSTQHIGVTPDVELPSAYSAEEFGESSQPTALPWDEIQPIQFHSSNFINDSLMQHIEKAFQVRKKSDAELKLLEQNIEELNKLRETTVISLNEEVRKKEIDELDEWDSEDLLEENATIAPEIKDIMNEDEIPDTYLKEGAFILSELILAKVS
ncbi:carboxy terminal-processing peptidase [Rapidithrix thailandica]|uniref:Carboxy terminal-processing peptidase n=1 Tax=Rapidithrix thailandica TaxID=413964 RepID=A0AAW9S6S9_9BACT